MLWSSSPGRCVCAATVNRSRGSYLTMHSFLLNLHVCSAAIGLISGVLAMVFRKGSGLHRAAGDVFTLSMLSMGLVAAYLAIFMKPNVGNVMGGLLVSYLVTTGWMAGRRREQK